MADGRDSDDVTGQVTKNGAKAESEISYSVHGLQCMADDVDNDIIVPETVTPIRDAATKKVIESDHGRKPSASVSDVIISDDVTSADLVSITEQWKQVSEERLEERPEVDSANHREEAMEVKERPRNTTSESTSNERRSSISAANSRADPEHSQLISEWIKEDLRNLMMTSRKRQMEESGQSEDQSPPSQINYLTLAVKNDSPHLVEVLLNRCTARKIYSALLYSINLGRNHITNIFLEHPKYQLVHQVTELIKSGVIQHNIKDQSEDEIEEEGAESVLTADVTPLMLAAQRNQFEVVQKLLDKGERIDEPHSTGCDCKACQQHGMDELRQAKTKLTTYKAMASDSYIVLASDDPIYVAFELAQKLKNLAVEEKHFKAEYLKLAGQIGDLTGRLLDKVRDGRELDILLNEKSGSGLSSYDNLARLKLAIHHEEKNFVAHPSCQKKLASLWIGDLDPEWIATPCRVLIFLLILCLTYPFAAVLYWIYPYNKVGRFLQIPLVKFAAATGSYFVFVCLVIGYGAVEKPAPSSVLCEQGSPIGDYCRRYMLSTNEPYINGTSTFVRYHGVGIGTVLLTIWLLGLIWESTKKLYQERHMYFTHNMYNILDFVMLWLYIFSFIFKFTAISLVNDSLAYFSKEESWVKLASRENEATSRIYWLNADRSTWVVYDLTFLSEAIFAVASLISVSKLTYVFTISERIGPLVISLAKMIEDMIAFMVLFVFIMAAFVVGFHNLFWYFYLSEKRTNGAEGDKETSSFSSIDAIVKECFWSIFGLVEMGDYKFYTSDNGYVTSVTGHVMFAFYNWMMVIILINMLIAMMSRSYEIIAETEDTEWKFARTKLFLEYIREGSTLAPPLNLVPTWKSLYLLHRKFADNWCRRCAGRPVVDRTQRWASRKEVNASTAQTNLKGETMNTAMTNLTEKRNQRLKYLMKDDMKTNHGKATVQYLEVIGEIKRRFVQQYRKGKHGENENISDDIDQIRQDMSALRQQLTSNFQRQDVVGNKMMTLLSTIRSALDVTRHVIVEQHGDLRRDNADKTDVVTCQLEGVDRRIADFRNAIADNLAEIDRQIRVLDRDERVALEILKDGMYRLCADVSVLRGRGALARDAFARAHDDVTGVDQTRWPDRLTTTTANRSMTSVVGSSDVTGNYGPVSITAGTVVFEE